MTLFLFKTSPPPPPHPYKYFANMIVILPLAHDSEFRPVCINNSDLRFKRRVS